MKDHNNMRKILVWTMFIIVAVCVLFPLIYWGFNPEKTQMEITKQFWPLYITVIIVFIIDKRYLKL